MKLSNCGLHDRKGSSYVVKDGSVYILLNCNGANKMHQNKSTIYQPFSKFANLI